MKYEELTVKELRDIAKKKGLKNISKMTKAQLIKSLKNTEINIVNTEISKESEPISSLSSSSMPTSPAFTEQKQTYRIVKDDYPIPETYNIDTLVLLPVDPAIQYCYWQISTNTRLQYKNYLIKSFYRYKLKLFYKGS